MISTIKINSMEKLNVLGLFSGIGGFERGLMLSGMNIKGLCEIGTPETKVLNKNFGKIPIFNDITKLNKEIINDTIGNVDVLCGGSPCVDISISGKNNGGLYGKTSKLWFEYFRIIDELRPKYAIMENVYALRSRGLEAILYYLSKIGYDAVWTTLDSQYFLPQRRRRIYILAVRDGIPTNADIFRNLERSTTECKQQVQSIKESRSWSTEKGYGKGQEVAYFTRQSFSEYATTGVASTLTKRDYKMFTDIVVEGGEFGRARKVTPQERLLLQGFPIDWFDGLGLSETEQYRMNGMNIPTVKWVGECLVDYHKQIISGEPFEPITKTDVLKPLF